MASTSRAAGQPGGVVPQDVVLVSHRGPLQFERRDGRREVTRGAGGLVTALLDVVRHVERATWVCAAITDEDRVVGRAGDTVALEPTSGCRVRMLDVDPDVHHDFYGVVANPLLWFVQHYLWDHGSMPTFTKREHDAWELGYVAVNRAFADEIGAVTRRMASRPLVMVHDYHFYLVPEMLRRRGIDAFVHFFVHIPWPQPDSWRALPPAIRTAIVRGLLGSDIVAFHTERYARNFLLTCQELLGLRVDLRRGLVRFGGRDVAVRFYPISIDEASLRARAESAAAQSHLRAIEARRPDRLVLRVDRTDPSKNIVRGFRAYERLLELHPELAERVVFLALLMPSRQDIPEYAAYVEEIHRTVDEVNERFGTPAWRPIDLRIGDNLELTVAAYRAFDVLMVNAVHDGMNLVAKEALVLSDRHGVLALSENTGAHEELGAVALTLHPFDVEQQARALHTALTMPPEERRLRHEVGVEIVRTNSVEKWLGRQFSDISRRVRRRRAAPARAG